MLDYLPMEIQLEIMQKLPVKSLLQFRSVSKSWKSRIDSSAFVSHYHTKMMHHLLVTYQELGDDKPSYVSIADDHTFPDQQVSPPIPLLVNMLQHSVLHVIGTSHGLLCLHGVYPKNQTNIAVLWNFSIRRAIAVVVPNVCGIFETFYGFGVCPVTNDPKIVKIIHINNRWTDRETISSTPWQVEVFALSTGVWRPLYSSNLPRESITLDVWWRVVADGFIYWLASDRITMDGGNTCYYLIMSFDITTEEFRQVNLPHCLAHESRSNLSMSKLRESLVVFHHGVEPNNPVIGVWMMEGGASKLFTKLFTININMPDARISTPGTRVMGFRESGEPIINIPEQGSPLCRLFVYDPNSKQFDHLWIDDVECAFLVYPYMETLLLLDKPNLAAYNEMETIRFLDDLAS